MKGVTYFFFFFWKKMFQLNIFIFMALFLSNFKDIHSTEIGFCVNSQNGYNQPCMDNIIILDQAKYKVGNFAKNKNGDLIIEFYAEDEMYSKRLFYGMTKDGRYYFPNNSPTYEITNIGNIGSARGRYESLNQLVVTQNDLNRENEFLFSTSSYESLTELHIMENRTYTYARSKNFMGKNKRDSW